MNRPSVVLFLAVIFVAGCGAPHQDNTPENRSQPSNKTPTLENRESENPPENPPSEETAVKDQGEVPQEVPQQAPPFKTIHFKSTDGLEITADLYQAHSDPHTPFIVLCHQAGWSRGEYREIAPKLNQLGFNCMAIDQRSGGSVNNVPNETFQRAQAQGKQVGYLDAEPDMLAAIHFVKKKDALGKVILWGSSYSSALTLRIAGEHPGLIDGALAFSPGEYFQRFGKPKDWIRSSAKKIKVPVFITSAKKETGNWQPIFAAIPGKKSSFIPKTPGNHGSRALWKKFDDSPDYWRATETFLKPFTAD